MIESEDMSHFEINGYNVWFEKFGDGPIPILFISGAIGTGRTDFQELLEGEDELDYKKFTAIAVEAPGWGRSRPPLRKYGSEVYDIDCQCFHELMQKLGYDKYSIVGYSDGARVALLMAAKYPDSVQTLVLSSILTYSSIKSVNSLLATKSLEKWNKRRLESYLKAYKTNNEIEKLWNRYLKFVEFYSQYFPDDIFKDKYDLVNCPTLITYGDQDKLIETEQTIDLSKRLMCVKLHKFSNGEHDCHQRYSGQYLNLVQQHILNPDNKVTKDPKYLYARKT